jgi:hypothetical protein
MCLALPGINVVSTKSTGCRASRFGIVLRTDNARAGEFEPFGEFEPEFSWDSASATRCLILETADHFLLGSSAGCDRKRPFAVDRAAVAPDVATESQMPGQNA